MAGLVSEGCFFHGFSSSFARTLSSENARMSSVSSTPPVRTRRDWVWPIALAAMVILASQRPRLASPDITHIDKVTHFSVYGLLATLVCRLGAGKRGAIVAWVVVALFGITDEWHQSFIPGRSSDVADWIADISGAAVAVGAYTFWTAYRRLLETPCGGRATENK